MEVCRQPHCWPSKRLPEPPLPFHGPRSLPLKKKTLVKNKFTSGSSQALCGHLKIERIQALSSLSLFSFETKINGKWRVDELGQGAGRDHRPGRVLNLY